jgi:hypothetical protein
VCDLEADSPSTAALQAAVGGALSSTGRRHAGRRSARRGPQHGLSANAGLVARDVVLHAAVGVHDLLVSWVERPAFCFPVHQMPHFVRR